MKLKTSELTGAALDWAVAKCMGAVHADGNVYLNCWAPSTDWAQGGPIIEREKVDIEWQYDSWEAHRSDTNTWAKGPTPLIAAMRCFVSSRLGETVEIPEELK